MYKQVQTFNILKYFGFEDLLKSRKGGSIDNFMAICFKIHQFILWYFKNFMLLASWSLCDSNLFKRNSLLFSQMSQHAIYQSYSHWAVRTWPFNVFSWSCIVKGASTWVEETKDKMQGREREQEAWKRFKVDEKFVIS